MGRAHAVLFGIVLAAGCGGGAPTTPATDFITLNSIAPAEGTILNPGDRITFTANVTVRLVTTDGFVTMAVVDQGNRSLNVAGDASPQVPLTKGTTTVSVSNTVTIPANGSGSTVSVFLPIFISGRDSTAAFVKKDYPVR